MSVALREPTDRQTWSLEDRHRVPIHGMYLHNNRTSTQLSRRPKHKGRTQRRLVINIIDAGSTCIIRASST